MTHRTALLGTLIAAWWAEPLISHADPFETLPSSSTVTRSDGSEQVYLPAAPNSAQNPALSPDGHILFFTIFHNGYNGGAAGIYTMPFEGGTVTTVLNQAGQDAVDEPGACWNGPTGRITFSYDGVARDEIWTSNPTGGDLFQVTHSAAPSRAFEPSFSPNGKMIVFEHNNSAGNGTIWKIGADGLGATRLSAGPLGGFDDRQPNWSPAGNLILFQRRPLTRDHIVIVVMSPTGQNLKAITSSGTDTDAGWSPDGEFICYSSAQANLPEAHIFAVSKAGGPPYQVTHNPTVEDGAPSWSPDGRWIYYESHTTAGSNSRSGIWRIAVARCRSLTLSPATVKGGTGATGTVAINAPAPNGGVIVTLRSGNPTVASVPPSVTIADGLTSATFPVSTSVVSMATNFRIFGTSAGSTKSSVLTVNP